jgi:hypothetical protein
MINIKLKKIILIIIPIPSHLIHKVIPIIWINDPIVYMICYIIFNLLINQSNIMTQRLPSPKVDL